MSSFFHEYLSHLIERLERVRNEESEQIKQAAKLMSDAIEKGHSLFAFGCTHSSLPIQDLVYRAGGLMLINPILAPGIASLDVHPVTLSSAIEQMTGYAKVIMDNTPIQVGDVLIIVSVSGRNSVPIEMAQIARERGIKVIGITSAEYTESVTSRHPSGKKMRDFADVILDNKAPKGDAVLSDPRIPQKFVPVSGATSIALLQSLVAATIEELLERGITPPVLLAANVDGGAEYNARLFAEYRERIHYL